MDNQPTVDPLALHHDSIVIDAHSDAIGDVLGLWVPSTRAMGVRSSWGQFDLPRAIEGGYTAIILATSYYPQLGGGGIKQALQFVDAFYREIEANGDCAMLATSAADIRRAKAEGKVAFVLSMEGAEGIEGDLATLRVFHRLGLRFLGFTWNRRNQAADGMDERHTGGGLTQFGIALVKECNRLGITIDLAHLSPAGQRDVLRLSERPVVCTHGGSQSFWSNPRSMTDDILRGIAASGGVIGLTPLPPLLVDHPTEAPLSRFLDLIDHVIGIVGEDAVGFGSDYDGASAMRTVELGEAHMLPNLTRGLVERGYRPDTIRKILGGNFLRVLETARS